MRSRVQRRICQIVYSGNAVLYAAGFALYKLVIGVLLYNMTIIVFLIDTSASMNQRTYLGTTYLDVAKASVENFVKIRVRDPQSRSDRYMLLTCEDPPANVKAGWRESAGTFNSELKNLKADGLTTLGPSLKSAFDLLNTFRMQSSVDTYGYGRCPFYLESAVIIVITDGVHLTSSTSVETELVLPMNVGMPGSDLTKEPFRWDQRIFGLVLRLPATVPLSEAGNGAYIAPEESSSIMDEMCRVTGGRAYAVSTQKALSAALESLVQKVQSGVVIKFEKCGHDPAPPNEGLKTENGDPNGSSKENQDTNMPRQVSPKDDEKEASPASPDSNQNPATKNPDWRSCLGLIYVSRSVSKGQFTGHWPIPEAFFPDSSTPCLPARTAHPVVTFSCVDVEPKVLDGLPFDKYELEPSPLTQYILERRMPNMCWQTFVTGSGRSSDQAMPFGYLKASSSLTAVNLFVMPYNYPLLIQLLEEAKNYDPKVGIPLAWREKFEKYIKTVPGYYISFLRRHLGKVGQPCIPLLPEGNENFLNFNVTTYLKKLKNQAKVEMDRMNASVGHKPPHTDGIVVSSRTKTSILLRRDFSQLLSSIGGNLSALKHEMTDYSSFHIAVPDPSVQPRFYRNAYDIPRESLLDQVMKMKRNFLCTSHLADSDTLMEQEEKHNLPVHQMGNYQEYVKKRPSALRPIDNQPARVHMFGNPFKVNKQNTENVMVDEAEDALFSSQTLKRKAQEAPSSPGPKRKRLPGPLPRHLSYQVLTSPQRSLSDEDYSDEDYDTASDGEGENPQRLQIYDSSDEISNMQVSASFPSHSDSSPASPGAGDFFYEQASSSHLPHHSVTGRHNVYADRNGDSMDVVHYAANGLADASRQETNTMMSAKEVWTSNFQLRLKVCKEVKKPGKDFSTLFRHLSTVQGSLDVQRSFVQSITHEAMRFKRKALASRLKQYEDSLVSWYAERTGSGAGRV